MTASGEPTIAPVAYPDLGPGKEPSARGDFNLLADVDLNVSVQLGRARLKVRDLLGRAEGSVVELDRAVGAPFDVVVNGRLIARGEVVVVDDGLGVRITELVQGRPRP